MEPQSNDNIDSFLLTVIAWLLVPVELALILSIALPLVASIILFQVIAKIIFPNLYEKTRKIFSLANFVRFFVFPHDPAHRKEKTTARNWSSGNSDGPIEMDAEYTARDADDN